MIAGGEDGPRVQRSRVCHLVVVLGRTRVHEHSYDRSIIGIGRDAIQDVVLDNPSVSRHHCQIRFEPETGTFLLEDLGSPNGTLLNGRTIQEAELTPGDDIGVGKFSILFDPSPQQLGRLDVRASPAAAAQGEAPPTTYLDEAELERVRGEQALERGAHLRPVGEGASRRYPLGETTVLGRSDDADVPLRGWLVARRHAVIVREPDGKYRLRHLRGLRRVYVNGRAVKERVLTERDRIVIGDSRLQFFPEV